MNTFITLHIPLAPVACSRPRVTRNGVYYSDRYNTFRKQSKALLMNQCKMTIPKEQLVHVEYTFVSRRQSNNCKGGGRQFKRSRPDLDNYIKAINDSLQAAGIIEDDSQIVSLSGQKLYGDLKEKPSIEIKIELL